MTEDPRFTRPLYTVAEAARYVGMPPSTLSAWAKGYRKTFADRPAVDQGPVITSIAETRSGSPSIPFIGLVEATVVQAFRQTVLPLQRVRRALRVLADQGELPHALASERMYTDGAQVLYDSGDPIFLHGGAPLSAVISRSKAGESMTSIAEDYEVPVADIEEALGAVLAAAA